MTLPNVEPLGRGDIIMVSNDPKPGNNNEQKGPRPWIVVSRKILNENSPFVWAIPFTRTYRDYPLAFNWSEEVPKTKTQGTLLCNQLTTLDVKHRQWELIEHAWVPEEVDLMIQAVLGYK